MVNYVRSSTFRTFYEEVEMIDYLKIINLIELQLLVSVCILSN